MKPATLIKLMDYKTLSGSVKVHPEDKVCIAFANRLRAWTLEGRLKAVWTHVANEVGGGTKGASLRYTVAKALGLIAGTSDYIFLWEGGCAALEAKAGKNKQSENQVHFQEWCLKNGVPYRVFYSADEGENILRELGVLR